MGKLAQIQLSFTPTEDRLLMRLGTDDGAEFRFWLTRRYVRIFWPVLHQLTLPAAHASVAHSPQAKAALADFEREQVLEGADFDSEFRPEANALPLGDDPVLLTRVQSKRNAEGAPVICLHPASGAGIDLVLEPQISHSLLALLERAVAQAEWELTPPALTTSAAVMPASEQLN